MPFAGYDTFEACVIDQQDRGHTEEEARRICGKLQAEAEDSRPSVRRYDHGGILDRAEPTPSGGARVPATLTRVGVFPYRLTDGTIRRELRPPEEVLHPDSLATLTDCPVTDLHPPTPVTAETWKQVSVGHVGPAEGRGDLVQAVLAIQDASTLALIESGARKEVSCGYQATLDPTPGVFRGEPYDAVQRGIRYNHVALGPVGWGRAGPQVALHLDSGDGIQDLMPAPEHTPAPVVKIRIDGRDVIEGSPEHVRLLESMLLEMARERDEARGRADAADKLLAQAQDPKAIQARITARAQLLDQARRLGIRRSDEAMAATDDLAMMVEMVRMIDPEFSPEGKSEDYIRGAFAALVKPALAKMAATQAPADGPALPEDEEPKAPPAPQAPAQDSILALRKGQPKAPEPDAAQARARMIQDSRTAWQKPLLSYRKD